MREPVFTRSFSRDLKRMMKAGRNAEKLKSVVRDILAGNNLPDRCRPHKLSGNFKDRMECHIEPDWLLIYKVNADEVVFEGTGTHADLFKK